jgi:hypothetical protein
MGVGIHSGERLFFNYAHIDNVHCERLRAAVYGGGGSNYYNIVSEFCKFAVYITEGGNNNFLINGHPYYTTDKDGKYITMSEAIVYATWDQRSTYTINSYDI